MKKHSVMTLMFVAACIACFAQTPLKRDSLRSATTVIGASPTKKDMIIITLAEMPIPLKNTLEGSEYQGWEKGKVYRTKLNDMFMVEIKRGATVETFRFDVNGKPLDP